MRPALVALLVSTCCNAACRHTLVDRSDGAHTDGKGCTLLQAVGRQVGRLRKHPKTADSLQHDSTSTVACAYWWKPPVLETSSTKYVQVAANGVEASATVLQHRKSDLLIRLDISFPLRCTPSPHLAPSMSADSKLEATQLPHASMHPEL